MKLSLTVSKFALLSIAFTLLFAPLNSFAGIRFYEQKPLEGYLEWTYKWALKSPAVTFKYKGEKVFLIGTDAEKKKEIANQIMDWMDVSVENFNDVNWTNEIDVTELVNYKFKNMKINRPLSVSGINCHGASFYATGLIKRLSYVGLEELNYYLDNYCEQVDSPKANTIGMFDRATIFSHSFKVVGPNVIFQKKSVDKKDPYKFYFINNYKTSEFYSCAEPVQQKFCTEKYANLYAGVERLDIIYNKILEFGQLYDLRKTIFDEISPMESRVQAALDAEPYVMCKYDLLRLKYRLMSLSGVGDAMKRNDFDNPGSLMFKREPKY